MVGRAAILLPILLLQALPVIAAPAACGLDISGNPVTECQPECHHDCDDDGSGDGHNGSGDHNEGGDGDCTATVETPGPTVTITAVTTYTVYRPTDIPTTPCGTETITSTITTNRTTVTVPGEPTETITITSNSTETVTSTYTTGCTTTPDVPITPCATETITSTITANGTTITTTDTITAPAETVTQTDTVTANGTTITTTDTITAPAETVTQTDTVTANGTTITATNTITSTATATVTSCPSGGGLDYGTCSDPSIRWEYALDGRTEYSYITNNQNNFPHGSSTTLDTLMSFICNRLTSPCNAPQETIDQCYASMEYVNQSGLEEEAASDLWNELMT